VAYVAGTKRWDYAVAAYSAEGGFPVAADGIFHLASTFSALNTPDDTVLRTILDVNIGIRVDGGTDPQYDPQWWTGMSPTLAAAVIGGDGDTWPYAYGTNQADHRIVMTAQLQPTAVQSTPDMTNLSASYTTRSTLQSFGQRKSPIAGQVPVVAVSMFFPYGLVWQNPGVWKVVCTWSAYLRVLFETPG
jgi:hypothetical protein